MDERVKKDIFLVLSGVIEILNTKDEADILELRKLSNHTIHNSTIFQDEDSISIAILIYALSKVIERNFGKVNFAKFLEVLNNARNSLDKGKIDHYRKAIKDTFSQISKLDRKVELYVEEVITQAQIKKGGKLHEHGVSIGRAADILGISQWELANYVGKTSLNQLEHINVVDRIKFVRGLFR